MGFQVQHDTYEEGLRTYWLKNCEYNNKDEVNSVNILEKQQFFCTQFHVFCSNTNDLYTIIWFQVFLFNNNNNNLFAHNYMVSNILI